MEPKTIYLREVNIDDAEMLYAWRNDETVRKSSFSEEIIEFPSHLAWLNRTLKSKDVLFYILVDDSKNVGQIRVNTDGKLGTISYSIDASFRNKGYGKKILELLEDKLIYSVYNIKKLQGLVKKENIASQKAFEKLGYVKEEKECIVYTKEIVT